MTAMIVVSIISSALPNAEVMVTLDFGLIVSLYRFHHFLEIRETAMLVSRKKVVEVNLLIFDVADLYTNMGLKFRK